MPTIQAIAAFLEEFAPSQLAEEWDNVGLLVGDSRATVARAMTCLSVTPASAAEAVRGRADLIVTHHPLPFAALKRVTAESTAGRLLLELIAARVAVYSPHTAFDSAARGINQRLAAGLGLRGVVPLAPAADGLGAGRWGWLEQPLSLAQLAGRLKEFLKIEHVQMVGNPARPVRTVAIACGAAGELLAAAAAAGCDAMVLGETRFHTCLEAEAAGMGLLLAGHFASERFALEQLAEVLAKRFPEVEIWASRDERDPLQWS
jgi:dinuclear metal center YbgI/SA1388 family protein